MDVEIIEQQRGRPDGGRFHRSTASNAVVALPNEPMIRAKTGLFILIAALLALAALLIGISQSAVAFGDEGFHLVASQLINQGKRPYLDFFYQHTPLYIYTNALWMRCFGDTWRSVHLFSALLTIASAGMIAGYVYSRVPAPSRFMWATAAAIFFATNVMVTQYTLLGMPAALCMCLVVAAFLVTVSAHDRPHRAFWVGMLSGAGIGVSLLTGPVAPVLLAWLLWHAEPQRRWKTFFMFAAGALISALPLIWLFVQAPFQMAFDTVAYQLWWRPTGLIQPNQPFIRIAAGVLNSTQGLVLVLLSLVGVAYWLSTIRRESSRLNSELRLCMILAAILTAYVGLAPGPIFAQYFLNVIPFAAILATVGVLALGTRIAPGIHSVWLVGIIVGIFLLAGLRSTRDHIRRPEKTWTEAENVAAFINEVTPPDSPFYTSDGTIYFAARRIPPTGFENNYAFRLELPPAKQKLLRVVNHGQIYASVAEGKFGSAIAWSAKEAESLNLDTYFTERREFPGHYVYWGWEALSQVASKTSTQ